MKMFIKKKLGDFARYCGHLLVFLWQYCWNTPYLRFLNVGFVNLLVVFGVGVLIDFLLKNILSTFVIVLLVNFFHVTFSFVMRKIFVYKTNDNWIKEYLRCYAFYSVSIVISMLVLLILIDMYGFAFWSAQILSLLVATLFYSLTSRYFAFMHVFEHKENSIVKKDDNREDEKEEDNKNNKEDEELEEDKEVEEVEKNKDKEEKLHHSVSDEEKL